MLAERGLPSGDLDGWAVEPKLDDGWRVTLRPTQWSGGAAARARRGHVVTESLPGGVNPGRRRPPGGDRARRRRPAGCRRRQRRLIAVAAPEFRDRLAV